MKLSPFNFKKQETHIYSIFFLNSDPSYIPDMCDNTAPRRKHSRRRVHRKMRDSLQSAPAGRSRVSENGKFRFKSMSKSMSEGVLRRNRLPFKQIEPNKLEVGFSPKERLFFLDRLNSALPHGISFYLLPPHIVSFFNLLTTPSVKFYLLIHP